MLVLRTAGHEQMINGWISPTNRFIPCGPYEHLLLLKTDPEMKVLLTKDILEEMDNVADAEKFSEELSDRGEHPEWHVFEMMNDDLQAGLRSLLMKNDFVRVGQYQNTLHFEGAKETLEKKSVFLISFAKSHGKDFKFEPQQTHF